MKSERAGAKHWDAAGEAAGAVQVAPQRGNPPSPLNPPPRVEAVGCTCVWVWWAVRAPSGYYRETP
jgi:hypothetical protein